jgi:hypothetical protein
MNNLVNQPSKKRKMSDSPNNTINASMLPVGMNGVLIKQEPPANSASQCSIQFNSIQFNIY